MTDLRSELDAWCQSYVTAFSAYDAAAIAAHWTFPALTTSGGRSFAFRSEEHFAANTQRLLSFYRAQNVDRAERRVLDVLSLHADLASMTVSDTMYDDNGAAIVSWQAAYVLQRQGSGWKAVMAVADGESAAWAARGTPLGG